jgi:hypothetical protein
MWFILIQFAVPELNQYVLNETQHISLKSFKTTVFNFLRIYVMLDGVDVAFILKIQIITYPAPVSTKFTIWLFQEQSVMTKDPMLLKFFKFTFFRAWKGDIL